MDIQQKKNNLRMDIKHLLKSKYVSANEKIANLLEELYADISNDNFNIVVLENLKEASLLLLMHY